MLESLGADDSYTNNFNREPLSEAGRAAMFKPIFFNKKEKSLSSSIGILIFIRILILILILILNIRQK